MTQLQSVVSREIDPARSAVLTVGRVSGGDAYNIIPDSCSLAGTIRTRSPETRDIMEAALRRIAAGVALTHRVDCDVAYRRNLPPVMNDERVLDSLVKAVRAQRGEAISELPPTYGAEDFAFFSERVPASHLMIGSSQPGRQDRLHNSDYQPDEASIAQGVAALTRAVVELLA